MTDHELIVRGVHWAVSAFALIVTAYVVPGFKVKNFMAALVAALVIGLANLTIRPLLVVLTLPLTVVTLGLFLLVVNAIVLKVCAAILRDFTITSWWSALFGGVILAIVNTGLHYLLV